MRSGAARLRLLLLCCSRASASAGDRDQHYRSCVAECSTAERCAAWQPGASLWMLGWSCEHDCRYRCMWQATDARTAAGGRTLQYHGKWPFVRVLGVQEPLGLGLGLGLGPAPPQARRVGGAVHLVRVRVRVRP